MSQGRTITEKSDPWKPSQGNLKLALGDAEELYADGGFSADPYTGRRVAPWTALQNEGAADIARTARNSNVMDVASNAYRGAMKRNPISLNARRTFDSAGNMGPQLSGWSRQMANIGNENPTFNSLMADMRNPGGQSRRVPVGGRAPRAQEMLGNLPSAPQTMPAPMPNESLAMPTNGFQPPAQPTGGDTFSPYYSGPSPAGGGASRPMAPGAALAAREAAGEFGAPIPPQPGNVPAQPQPAVAQPPARRQVLGAEDRAQRELFNAGNPNFNTRAAMQGMRTAGLGSREFDQAQNDLGTADRMTDAERNVLSATQRAGNQTATDTMLQRRMLGAGDGTGLAGGAAGQAMQGGAMTPLLGDAASLTQGAPGTTSELADARDMLAGGAAGGSADLMRAAQNAGRASPQMRRAFGRLMGAGDLSGMERRAQDMMIGAGGAGPNAAAAQDALRNQFTAGSPLGDASAMAMERAMAGNPVLGRGVGDDRLQLAQDQAMAAAIPAAMAQFANSGMANSSAAQYGVTQAAMDAAAPYTFDFAERNLDREINAGNLAADRALQAGIAGRGEVQGGLDRNIRAALGSLDAGLGQSGQSLAAAQALAGTEATAADRGLRGAGQALTGELDRRGLGLGGTQAAMGFENAGRDRMLGAGASLGGLAGDQMRLGLDAGGQLGDLELARQGLGIEGARTGGNLDIADRRLGLDAAGQASGADLARRNLGLGGLQTSLGFRGDLRDAGIRAADARAGNELSQRGLGLQGSQALGGLEMDMRNLGQRGAGMAADIENTQQSRRMAGARDAMNADLARRGLDLQGMGMAGDLTRDFRALGLQGAGMGTDARLDAQRQAYQGAALAPSIAAGEFMAGDRLMNLGGQIQGENQRAIDAAMGRHYETQYQDLNNLLGFADLSSSLGGMGGTRTTAQGGPGIAAQLGGGLLGGLGTYGALAANPVTAGFALPGAALAGLMGFL